MQINQTDYRNRVLGCWMGKNIGGTLGAPFEWRRQVNAVSFYAQDLGGEPLPNDDLDIQLLWLVALEERGIDLDANLLSEYWTLYVTPHWSEYGTAKINMRSGLQPPLSGAFGNAYKDSCGAFIRSEIWACIAPGHPALAARYACQDAILDHGDGEGTYAAVFTAALESAAFVLQDIESLIDVALSYIPGDCGVVGAVRCVREARHAGHSWLEARDAVLAGFRGDTFFGYPAHTSDEDRRKGFADGRRGWDAPSNIGMLLIGLLYGKGDFGQSLCTAVNCGEDTDCTAATAGAIFGILHGIAAIPDKWIAPVGSKIKTACLNLGELGYFGNQLPATIEDLTDRTLRIAQQVALRWPVPLSVVDAPTDLSDMSIDALAAGSQPATLYEETRGPQYRFADFIVAVEYGAEGPVARSHAPKSLRVRIRNTYKVQANLALHWYLPDGWGSRRPPTARCCRCPGISGRRWNWIFNCSRESSGGRCSGPCWN